MEESRKLIIRKAAESDVPAVEAVEKACFSVPWSYESLYHDILENKLAFYIVAEIDGKVCGYVGVWKIFDEGHITNVAIAPECILQVQCFPYCLMLPGHRALKAIRLKSERETKRQSHFMRDSAFVRRA